MEWRLHTGDSYWRCDLQVPRLDLNCWRAVSVVDGFLKFAELAFESSELMSVGGGAGAAGAVPAAATGKSGRAGGR